MAAQGMMNKGIAQSLFVTTKTVETHLRHWGDGPLELRNYTDEGSAMYQAVYAPDGSYALHDVGGGFFDVSHAHFHYAGFNHEGLYDLDGHLIATGPQKGMCLIDLVNWRHGSPGDGPNTGHFLATKALHGLCHSFLACALTCNFFGREGGI